jgi:flagellar assembly factor FliW
MFKIKTLRFGEIEVNEEEIITLPGGLIGFPEYTRYVLLDHDKDGVFKWMQSLDEGAIAFTVIDPLQVNPTYTAGQDHDCALIAIVTMPTNPDNATVNLKAPLVINIATRTGKQVIIPGDKYFTRHNLLELVG